MRHLKTTLAVLGAVTVLVLAANTVAMAATGGSFLLGKSNSANAVTSLTRTTAGSALKLTTTSSSTAPLSVNGKGTVTNLNADMVDGVSASTLKSSSIVFTSAVTPAVTNWERKVPLASGSWLINWTAFLHGAHDEYVDCYVYEYDGNTSKITADSAINAGPDLVALSASGLVTKNSGNNIYFTCTTSGVNAFDTTTEEPIQIVATKIDTKTTGTLVVP